MYGLANGLWKLATQQIGHAAVRYYLRRENLPEDPYTFPVHRAYYAMIDRIESLMAQGRHFISLKDITGDFS